MILPSAPVRYLLTEKTNYRLGQGHSASPSRVRKRNGEYSDPSLERAAWGPSPSIAASVRKALVLLMVGQLKMQSWATAGDAKGDISCRTTSLYSLENTKLKALLKGLVLFCFPELKLNLSHHFEVFSEIKLEPIFSLYHAPNY